LIGHVQVVRRLAVSSTNAAAQYKPQLIINQLASLMPMLYAETEVKKELIREYQMGPFVGMYSEAGPDARATAYRGTFNSQNG
jgi:hypothetical protein